MRQFRRQLPTSKNIDNSHVHGACETEKHENALPWLETRLQADSNKKQKIKMAEFIEVNVFCFKLNEKNVP